MNRTSQRGIALVITLIMLAVVTVMVVMFLGISRRERSSVIVTADLTDAKLAADIALNRAQSEVISRIAATSNLFAYDLRVSTNFLRRPGFQSGLSSFENVGYTYGNGNPLNTEEDLLQNLTNLFYDPRPPVYINTSAGTQDFRYYLDINRNRRFDTNGLSRGLNANNVFQTNLFVGDPEWIGVLERPDEPHSSSNRFISRYAYIIAPAGKTLDINFIHNSVKHPQQTALTEGYRRNQGVGSWEINLAAFLRDLNTNFWTAAMYDYRPDVLATSQGAAFDVDALSILRYRYTNNYATLERARQTFGIQAGLLSFDQVDMYGTGRLMTGRDLPVEDATIRDNPDLAWAGSDNLYGYYSILELFDNTKVAPAFVNRLQNSMVDNYLYNRDTFGRLLSQIGADSLPANRNKLHLNFDNVAVNGAIVPSLATNLTAWTPIRFFTNAARLMLQSQFGAQFTPNGTQLEIPVWPTNYYGGSVHRMLQLAANIWDSGTNRLLAVGALQFPTVFKPRIANRGTNIAIVDFVEVTNTNFLSQPWRDLNLPGHRSSIQLDDNVFGVPLVIGARKGYPNFNEFSQQTLVQVTRRLQGEKRTVSDRPSFSLAYEVGITNSIGLEAWNSYTQAYPRALSLYVANTNWFDLRDSVGSIPLIKDTQTNTSQAIPANIWQPQEFRVPLTNTFPYVPMSTFNFTTRSFSLTSANPVFFRNPGYPIPDWKLYITNRVQFFLIDTEYNRVVDAVNFDNMVTTLDIGKELVGSSGVFADTQDIAGSFWQTNRTSTPLVPGSPTTGITNQIWVSLTNVLSDWRSYSASAIEGQDKEKAIDNFRAFMGLPPLYTTDANSLNPGLVVQVPFTPTRKLYLQMSWQANDPLVHYHLDDLYDPIFTDTNNVLKLTARGQPSDPPNLGLINPRYRPWGRQPGKSIGNYNPAIQDPLIRRSDDWNFTSNSFPTIGWLGRVHRGTPWQTVYLKSEVEPVQTWAKWSGRLDTHPTNDWWLVDLFTTAPNDNAARGLLSVNQTNVAAWSAVLSGVQVLTNTLSNESVAGLQDGVIPAYTNLMIWPGTPQLYTLVTNINVMRGLQPGGYFRSLGQVLASPALTLTSPYLNTTGDQAAHAIADDVYERIPQQILSLLKSDEPFVVIYSFGQSLKPADRSLVAAPGVYNGLCTNYQITGEYVTKTAIRFEEMNKQEGRPNTYRAVVENYQVLPPE